MKSNATEEIAIVRKLLQKDFEYEPVSSTSFEELKKELTKFLDYLINNDFPRLLQGLYRIDVNEERVKEILNVAPPDKIADRLADLIFERQHQKALTRLRYL